MPANTRLTLTYTDRHGQVSKTMTADHIQHVTGPRIDRKGNAGTVWNIAVLDADGNDITHTFPCFT